MRRPARSVLAVLGLTVVALASPAMSPASAHAIIDLGGVSAVAGTTTLMTLEVQHGCLPSEPTVQVQAFVGKPWRAVVPQPVDGWQTTVSRQSTGGWTITWTNLGTPIPFGTATYFPIKVAWPSQPGVYAMSVLQLCPGSSYYWNTPPTPATANSPSPPLTPRPEVQVVVKKATGTTQPTPTAGHTHPY